MAKDVFVLDAQFSPFGRFGSEGGLRDYPASLLGAQVIQALFKKNELEPEDFVGGVYMGQVLTAGEGQNPARQAALCANLPYTCSTLTFGKVCASSLTAIHHARNEILLDTANCMIAGGMENMTRAPYLLDRPKKLTGDQKLSAFGTVQELREMEVIDSMRYDGLLNAFGIDRRVMGYYADICARVNDISKEEQDIYAWHSMDRAHRAQEYGVLKRRIVPMSGYGPTVEGDEWLREPDYEKMKKSRTVFYR